MRIQAGFSQILEKNPSLLLGLEYQSSLKLFSSNFLKINPIFGGICSTNQMLYLYGGILLECFLTNSLFIGSSISPGFFYKGKGKDLGFPLEYKTTFHIGHQKKTGAQFGLSISHFSNAGLSKNNGGMESVSLFYTMPIDASDRLKRL